MPVVAPFREALSPAGPAGRSGAPDAVSATDAGVLVACVRLRCREKSPGRDRKSVRSTERPGASLRGADRRPSDSLDPEADRRRSAAPGREPAAVLRPAPTLGATFGERPRREPPDPEEPRPGSTGGRRAAGLAEFADLAESPCPRPYLGLSGTVARLSTAAVPPDTLRRPQANPAADPTAQVGARAGPPLLEPTTWQDWCPAPGKQCDHSDRKPLRPPDARMTADAKVPPHEAGALRQLFRQRPTLPGEFPPSTIGAGGLNFRVRNGNGCDSAAMVTGNLYAESRSDSGAKTLEPSIASTSMVIPKPSAD